MIKQTFKIKGITPFVFSKPLQNQAVPKTDSQLTAYALSHVYTTESGDLYAPNTMIKGAIRKGIQIGKMKIEKSAARAETLVKALLYVFPAEIPFLRPDNGALTKNDLELYDYHVIGDQNKLIWTRAARIHVPWMLECEIAIHEMLEMKFIEQALINGGLLSGIGGRRPENGRFEII